jgi:membrane associated rhomboid family serine protease
MAYGNSFQKASPVVFNLIIINVLVFFAQAVFGGLTPLNKITDLFALHHYKSDEFRLYQLVTYMFMHGGIAHMDYTCLEALWKEYGDQKGF